jgi:protein-tyrosine phosphatase
MNSAPDQPFPGTYWVYPGRLLAGPYPKTQDRLSRLLAAGVTCFIDLTELAESDSYMLHLPESVQYRRFSIHDFDTPTADHMRCILDAIDTKLADGQVVYVHCWGGIGRTGTVVGCYLVRHGMTGEDALAEIVHLRGLSSPETEEQRRMVLSWCEEAS